MSAPTTRLLTDAMAAEINALAATAILRPHEFSETARELALATNALLQDSEACCELMAPHRTTPEEARW
jgi:hypothetical protein